VVKRTRIVENTWTCNSCSTKNLGRFMACQNCQSPKEKDEKDVVPAANSAPTVTDAELLRLANQKANWICEYCNGQVRDEHGKCVKNCGAPKPKPEASIDFDDGVVRIKASNGGSITGLKVNGKTYNTRDGKVEVTEDSSKKTVVTLRGAVVTQVKRLPWTGIAIGAGATAVVALFMFLFSSWEEDVKVAGIEWHYQADLHQRTLMHGSDWGSPSGAFNISCNSKFYGTEDCHPHDCRPHSVSYDCNCKNEECNCRETCRDNGNGFSTCSETCSTCRSCETCSKTEYDTCYDQCDVYRDWCTYDYYEWPIVATQKTAGAAHDEHWPALAAEGDTQRLDRTERYEVDFTGKSDKWVFRPAGLQDFQRFKPQALWKIKVNRAGMVTPLKELAAK